MQEDTYTTVCNKCYKKTWYETEQPCHMSYPKSKTCSLGHVHINNPYETERCTGTLMVIDKTNINTHLTVGERYTFRDKAGIVKRFTVGRTSGWKPCLLLLHNARSTGSSITVNAPDIHYKNGAYETNTYFI